MLRKIPASFLFCITALVAAGPMTVHTQAGENRRPDAPPGQTFQISMVSRVETDINGVFTGYAESLQAKRPGVILGPWVEEVIEVGPEDPSDPDNTRRLALVRDSLDMPSGSIFWEGWVTTAPAIDGNLTFTSNEEGVFGPGSITGGTGRYAGVTGEAILAGRIAVCELGTDYCAESDQFPADLGLGLRFECHWILRGTLAWGKHDGNDD